MEQFKHAMEGLKDEEMGLLQKESSGLKEGFASTVHETVIEVKKSDIPGKLISEAKHQLQDLLGNKEGSDFDSHSSSSSDSSSHKQNGVVVPAVLQEPPKETRIDFVELIEGRLEDFDVERILGTHGFCCPNCRSSTTVRVILRKKPGPTVMPPQQPSRPVTPRPPPYGPVDKPGEPSLPPSTDPADRPEEVFGCLRCFKLYINRAGNYLGRLWHYGRQEVSETEHDPDRGLTAPPENGQRIEAPEIVKSIVYGGLNETIASLSVVASAAGAGSSTLNIVALALANLFSGLLVLVQSLVELKSNQVRGNSEDRYQEQLGKRNHFVLHATLAVLSYLVFGVLSPVIYAFAFRETNDRDLKLEVVAAAALLCIAVLAIGKAHTQRKPYVQTLLFYVITGFSASGLSYLVGEQLNKLLGKLRWFPSNSAGGMSLPGTGSMGTGWSSY